MAHEVLLARALPGAQEVVEDLAVGMFLLVTQQAVAMVELLMTEVALVVQQASKGMPQLLVHH